jgi:hypothetical protein
MSSSASTRRILSALLLLAPLACAPGDDLPADRPGSAGPLPEGATLPADHPPVGALPADHPPLGTAPGATAAPEGAPEAVVKEVMRSGGYTYALLEMDGGEIWSAGPITELEEGDRVALVGTMGMENFRAASLDRTFDRLLFVSGYVKR